MGCFFFPADTMHAAGSSSGHRLITAMPTVALESSPLRIALGEARDGGVLDAGVPVLAGENVEALFGRAQPAGRMGALTLFETDGWLIGGTTVTPSAGLADAAHQLYGNILQATRGLYLARIWNYIPAINAAGPDGLENYRAFCQGRSLAFEQLHGSGFKALLPSASAVGTPTGALTVVFVACRAQPRHVENPLQLPAYDYPREYGPRPPSFARATVVSSAKGATVFISGTAAIRGHATVAPNSTREQLDITLENLDGIARACGLAGGLDTAAGATRHFKVYLRRAADQPVVAAVLEERLFRTGDRVAYLQADICRAPLLLEIEATLFGVAGVTA